MKFRFGSIPDSPAFTPAAPWQPLDEPGSKTFIWFALPFGVLSTAAFVILWLCLTPLSWNDFLYWFFSESSFLDIVLPMVALFVIHELIHAVIHPGYGLSSKTIFGIWLSRGALYAHWDDEWSRNRAIACLLTPVLVLSVLPLLMSMVPFYLVPWLDDSLMAMFFFISVLNAFCACADLMGARLFFWQVPARGILRNKGYYTYWRHG